MSGQIQYGPADPATASATRTGYDDTCHFAAPVRFGRRKTDQVGHLRLTTMALTFRGTVDVRFLWGDVALVEHIGNQLVVSLHGTRRTLRFCCEEDDTARRAAIIAAHLAALAQADPLESV